MISEVGVIVVTFNSLPHVERCLESVRQYETVVVDNGSTDGTAEEIPKRFPGVRLVRQANRGLAAGWRRGIEELGSRRYFLLLNADAWVIGDSVARLVAFADANPDAAVVAPQLLNTDGTLQRSIRGFPTTWRLATEYLFLRRIAPGLKWTSAASGAGIDHTKTREAEWVVGAAMLVRGAAVTQVGPPDDQFFLFSEEVDWCYRFSQAGWKVLYYPEAKAVHVGEASHQGRMARELARSNLRYIAKHHGEQAAEHARWVMLVGVALRALVRRGGRPEVYWEAVRWLSSGSARELLERPGP